MNWIAQNETGGRLVAFVLAGVLGVEGMGSCRPAHASSADSGTAAAPVSEGVADSAPLPSTDSHMGEVAEVVVTARRTEEKLKDVPVAVTALSGAALAEQH